MSFSAADVYSYFECDQLAIKVAGDEEYTRDDCIGSLTVERETKTVTKSCRGVVKKRKTKPTGNGTITLSLHIKLALYRKINNMVHEGLQPGVIDHCIGEKRDEEHIDGIVAIGAFCPAAGRIIPVPADKIGHTAIRAGCPLHARFDFQRTSAARAL